MSIYAQAVPLDRATHRSLRLRERDDIAFAAAMNSVPLTLAEFDAAAREYAIVFAADGDGGFLPAILLGLSDRSNLYLGDDARWERGYVPAFLRQSPFVLAIAPGTGAWTVCVDLGDPRLSDDEGEPLFDADGGETALLRGTMRFLGDYRRELERTQAFGRRLQAAGLLEPRVVRLQWEGGVQELGGLHVVSESRLRALEVDHALPLLRSGELGALYLHLNSLNNLERLADRHRARSPAPDARAEA